MLQAVDTPDSPEPPQPLGYQSTAAEVLAAVAPYINAWWDGELKKPPLELVNIMNYRVYRNRDWQDMRATQRLTSVNSAYQIWCMLWPDIKMSLQNNVELEVEIRRPKRSTEQNAKLHATIDELASVVPWAGKLREPEVWKRLLVAAWLRAKGSQIEVLPALDGHGVDLVYAPTSSLTKDELSDLLEYVESFAAVHLPEVEC